METWNNKEMRVPGEDFEDGPWSSFKDFKDGPLLSSWTRADTFYACQIKSGERFADSHKTKYEFVPLGKIHCFQQLSNQVNQRNITEAKICMIAFLEGWILFLL